MPPVVPVIHLNGTSRDSLKGQLGDVYCALNEVATLLRQAAPNGRDYYPVPGLMDKAVAQHQRRLQIVRDLQDEIESEMEGIDQQ